MVLTNTEMVGVGREDQGVPLVPVIFLVEAKALEVADECGGEAIEQPF